MKKSTRPAGSPADRYLDLDFLDAEWGERLSVEALARLEVANREREVVDEDLGHHGRGLYFRPSDTLYY